MTTLTADYDGDGSVDYTLAPHVNGTVRLTSATADIAQPTKTMQVQQDSSSAKIGVGTEKRLPLIAGRQCGVPRQAQNVRKNLTLRFLVNILTKMLLYVSAAQRQKRSYTTIAKKSQPHFV